MREHVGQRRIHLRSRGFACSTSSPVVIELLPAQCILLDLISFRVEGRLFISSCHVVRGSFPEVMFNCCSCLGFFSCDLACAASVSDCVYWFAVHVSYACRLNDAVVRPSPSDIGSLVHRRALSTVWPMFAKVDVAQPQRLFEVDAPGWVLEGRPACGNMFARWLNCR